MKMNSIKGMALAMDLIPLAKRARQVINENPEIQEKLFEVTKMITEKMNLTPREQETINSVADLELP